MRKKAKRYALSAAVFLLTISLTSCSVISINQDKWSGHIDSTAGTETVHAPDLTTAVTDADTGKDVPLTPYEYTGKETAESLLAGINFSFDGGSVFIRSTGEREIKRMLTVEEGTDNTYSAAIYERLRMVEETLGCKVHYTVTTLDEMMTDIAASIVLGDYYADMLAVPAGDMAQLARGGYLLNLYSLPFLDMEAEYFRSETGELSAGNEAYGVISCATADPDDMMCVFYDTEKVSDDLQSLVKSGNWTWDALLKYAGTDGISTDETEPEAGYIAELVTSSSGARFVSHERGVTPTVTLPDMAADAVTLCRRLIGESVFKTADAASFGSGGSTFRIGRLGDMETLADSKVVWDVLPMPKLSAEQKHYSTPMPEPSLVMSVPAYTTNPQGASALIRAFAAASYGYMRDAYLEYHMYNTVRRESTLSMIEIIYENPYYEFSHVFGAAGDDIKKATYALIPDAAVDAEADIAVLFDERREAADKELSLIFPVG